MRVTPRLVSTDKARLGQQLLKPTRAEREKKMLPEIDLKALSAALLIAPKDKSRPNLSTICLEPNGDLIACDGYMLLIWPNAVEYPPEKRLMVTIDDRRALPRKAAKSILDLERGTIGFFWSNGQEIRGAMEFKDYDYPNYQNVIPPEKVFSTGYFCFNAETFAKAQKVLSTNSIEIEFHGPTTPATVRPAKPANFNLDVKLYVMPTDWTDRAARFNGME